MYFVRFVAGCLFVLLSYSISAQRLYVFAVVGPGTHYQPDRERLRRMADSMAYYGGYQQCWYAFDTRQTFTAEVVRQTLAKLHPQNASQDVIWFHYAGRGYSDKPLAWPTLQMGKSKLAVRDVLATLRSKPARTLLVTVDCANQPLPADTTAEQPADRPPGRIVKPRLSSQTVLRRSDSAQASQYRQLIKADHVRQVIVMAAASHGQRAYRTIEQGSVWLSALERGMQAARDYTGTAMTWKQIQARVARFTQQKTSNRQIPLYNRQTITCCETDSLP